MDQYAEAINLVIDQPWGFWPTLAFRFGVLLTICMLVRQYQVSPVELYYNPN
jgi:hypothetical protein